jgi:MFS family permease
MLLGSALSGVVSRLVRGRLGLMVLAIDCLAGLALAALSAVHSTITGAVLLAVTGVLAGIAQIAIVSWIQRRVAPEMMGRAMSVLMFTFMGLGPISAAVAGSLLKVISLTSLFAGAGLLLTAIALGCMRSHALRSIGGTPRQAMPG